MPREARDFVGRSPVGDRLAKAFPLHGPVPRCAGAFAGRPFLVIGCGRCVREDLEAAGHADWPGIKIAVNRAGEFYRRPIDAWVTMHPRRYAGPIAWRYSLIDGACEVALHSSVVADTVRWHWPLDNAGPDSGALATIVGLYLTAGAPGVLAGVPQDDSGHFYDLEPGGTDFGKERAGVIAWQSLFEKFRAFGVTSLSGRTRGALGAPDLDAIRAAAREAAA